MATKEFKRWLRQYDQLRTNPYEPNQSWTSTKFEIEGLRWDELKAIEIPDLLDQDGNPMNWGQACSALRKTWYRYKTEKRQGINVRPLAYRIKKIQRSMGITEAQFPELDEEWAGEQLDMEEGESELLKEEAEENMMIAGMDNIWGLGSQDEDPEEEEEEEDKEDEDEDATWEGV